MRRKNGNVLGGGVCKRGRVVDRGGLLRIQDGGGVGCKTRDVEDFGLLLSPVTPEKRFGFEEGVGEGVGEKGPVWNIDEDVDVKICDRRLLPEMFQVLKRKEVTMLERDDDEGERGFKKEITNRIRSVVVDWLFEVVDDWSLKMESLYLAVSIFDRVINGMKVKVCNAQLAGIVCLSIACKVHEAFPKKVKDVIRMTDYLYNVRQILDMEMRVLYLIEWQLDFVSSWNWLDRFVRAGVRGCVGFDPGTERKVAETARFISELCLQHGGTLSEDPSVVAYTAVLIGLSCCNLDCTTNTNLDWYAKVKRKRANDLAQRIAQVWTKYLGTPKRTARYILDRHVVSRTHSPAAIIIVLRAPQGSAGQYKQKLRCRT